MKKHHWLILLGVLLIIQFPVIAPTGTPEDMIVTVPLIVIFGMGGYSSIFAISLLLCAVGVLILFCVSKPTLTKLRKKI